MRFKPKTDIEKELDRLREAYSAACAEKERVTKLLHEKIEKMAASALANESQLQDEVARLSQQNENLRDVLAEAKKEIARLREVTDFLTRTRDAFEQENAKLREENEAWAKAVTEHDGEVTRLREACDTFSKNETQYISQYNALLRERDDLDVQLARLREALESCPDPQRDGQSAAYEWYRTMRRNALKETHPERRLEDWER